MTGTDNSPEIPQATFNVGHKLLVLRQFKGLSQREVARRAGMTNGNLSLIEQGKVSPSIQSLEKILVGLSVGLSEFFSSNLVPSSPVIAPSEFVHLNKHNINSWVQGAVGQAGEPFIVKDVIAPGACAKPAWAGKAGMIKGFVMYGVLSLKVDTDTYSIEEGAGYQLACGQPFEFANPATKELVLVSMIVG